MLRPKTKYFNISNVNIFFRSSLHKTNYCCMNLIWKFCEKKPL